MPGWVRMVLALLPLSAYFFMLGLWQSGRRPRVVPGPRDFGLLAFGLGGLVAFGPVGQVLVDAIFPRPSAPAWLAVASFVTLLAMAGSVRTRTRVVVYHVEPAELIRAAGDAMRVVTGTPPARTVQGFEDASGRRGVSIEIGRRLGIGVVEAHGEEAGALAEAIYPILRGRLGEVESPPAAIGAVWFALSVAMILAHAGLVVITTPAIRAAIRKLGGG